MNLMAEDMKHEKPCWQCYGWALIAVILIIAAVILDKVMDRPLTPMEQLHANCVKFYSRPIDQVNCMGAKL